MKTKLKGNGEGRMGISWKSEMVLIQANHPSDLFHEHCCCSLRSTLSLYVSVYLL